MNGRAGQSRGPSRQPSGSPGAISRGVGGIGALAIGLLAFLALSTGAAQAASLHAFSRSFAAPGSGAGQLALGATSGVAVNDQSGEVYVADTGNRRVSVFSAAGAFSSAFGWGVADGTTAAPQTCTSVCFAGLSGSGAGQFEAPSFIAVDNSAGSSHGDIYVADSEDRLITKFDASGSAVSTWGDHQSPAEAPQPNGQLAGRESPGGTFANEFGASFAGIAVDAAGDLWVYTSNSRMLEFDQAGAFLREWGGPGARPIGISLDSLQTVYLGSGFEQVEKLSAEGIPIGPVTATPEPENGIPAPIGLAVDQPRGDLYVDLGARVAHYSGSCIPGSCFSEESFGGAQLAAGAGLAVDGANAKVYVADHGSGQVHLFERTIEARTGPANALSASQATLTGNVEPVSSPLTSCEFEYGQEGEFEASVPCTAPLPITGPTPVEADLSGLGGGSEYNYRLAVSSAAGTLHAESERLTTTPTATISAPASSEVAASSARLSARVTPNGLPISSCTFEFGPSGAYGSSVPCEPGATEIGAGFSPVAVSAQASGLQAGTTYHWRLVVVDANGSAASPDQTFVLAGAGGLPDGRRYELVTPARKNGALFGKLFAAILPQISADGTRVLAPTVQCFEPAPSCVGARQNEGGVYAFNRTPGGWGAEPISPPATLFATSSYWSLDANSNTGLFSAPSPPDEQDNFFAREADGSFVEIGPLGEGFAAGNYENLLKEGLLATAGATHLIYGTHEPAWSFDASEPARGGPYEYSGRHNQRPRLVGVSGGEGSTSLIGRCGTIFGNQKSNPLYRNNRPLSGDGRVIFFTVAPCSSGSGANEGVAVPSNQLYARIDGDRADAHTVKISEPSSGVCASPECEANNNPANQAERSRDASYQGASVDGTSIFFTSTQQLTDSATQDPARADSGLECEATTEASAGCNLYLSTCPTPCAEPGGERDLLDVSASLDGGPAVQRVIAISADGSHVYFVARGVLTESPNASDDRARLGARNLYVYERSGSVPQGRIGFISALSPQDLTDQLAFQANISANGDLLVFLSHRGLTAGARSQGPAQVYSYDDRSASLTRLSIGEAGFNNNGNSAEGDASLASPVTLIVPSTTVPQRFDPTMSDDGSYIFFSSPAALVPAALDNVPAGELNGVEPLLAQNIYEYHDGHVALISDGADTSVGPGIPPIGVELLGSDTSGDNVFFSTADRLVAQDTDTQLDIYDAHLCSAVQPCAPPPVSAPAPCEGEACRGAASSPAAVGSVASAEFSGPGNRRQKTKNQHKHGRKAKCSKARKRGHGRCATKHGKPPRQAKRERGAGR